MVWCFVVLPAIRANCEVALPLGAWRDRSRLGGEYEMNGSIFDLDIDYKEKGHNIADKWRSNCHT